MEGGLARTSSLYPIYFTQVGYPSSSIIPYVNFNEDKRTGFDFSVYANKKVGEVDLTLGVSGMWYKVRLKSVMKILSLNICQL